VLDPMAGLTRRATVCLDGTAPSLHGQLHPAHGTALVPEEPTEDANGAHEGTADPKSLSSAGQAR
jgi:hypothetical protein